MRIPHPPLNGYEFYQQSLSIGREIGNRYAEAFSLNSLGHAYFSLKQYEKAIDFFNQAAVLAREARHLDKEAYYRSTLGAVHFLLGQYEQATDALFASLEISESLRDERSPDEDKITFFDTQSSPYLYLQQALVAQGKIEQALEISERGRARAFVSLLAQKQGLNTSDEPLPSPSIAHIQQLARQENVTLVQYSDVSFINNKDFKLFVWVIQPSGTVHFREIDLAPLNSSLSDLITTARQTMGVRGSRAGAPPQLKPEYIAQIRADTDRQLTQLHDLLIAPIADLLPTNPEQNVVFIPDGELFLVPFPALKDSNGKYLLEKHTILTAPSIQLLQLSGSIAERRQGATPPGNPLIVGNPTMPTVTVRADEGGFADITLHPLPGSQQEATSIATLLNATALIGDRATEATVKQQLATADLIHFATHGLLEYGDPLETGSQDFPGAIALASGSGENGLLTSSEILQMNLQANLVVLSACDTGRGRITGDGIIGLSRSFIVAGVPSLVVSLWAVPDAPTAELMREFYTQLGLGQPKAQALRQAMLTTMQTHPDPRNWAAFTLIGESE